nr:TonB-dependent receptor plug domain-containing protein [uncultured Capnocytophaga sp.]
MFITTYVLSAQKIVTKDVSEDQNLPFYVVNGVLIDDVKIARIFLSTINPNHIESINVLKSATTLSTFCSNRAENGVVIITLKKLKKGTRKGNLERINSKNLPLVVIDEVVCSTPEIGRFLINYINPEIIDSISVVKGEQATSLYGEKAKNGVLLITLKGKTEKLDISLIEKTP